MIRRERNSSARTHSGPRHWHQTIPSLSGGAWGCPPTSLVLANHKAISTFVNRADNLYNDQNMMQALFEQEAVNSLYKLGDIIAMPHPIHSPVVPLVAPVTLLPAHPMRPEERPLPNLPPGMHNHHEDHHYPVSDYATINEEAGPSDRKSHDVRRERHIRELKQMSEDFNKPLTELGIENSDREWNQWLEIQGLIDHR